jgi:type VI secretion system Hcp family effector
MDFVSRVRLLRCALLVAVCCAATSTLADDVYLNVEGATQGKIVGEVTQKGLEGRMRAIDVRADVQTPVDQMTGTKISERRHTPVVVMREPGRGSPQLFHALVTNENLKEVRLDYFGPRLVNGVRVMSLYQTIRLTNARLIGYRRDAEPATDTTAGAMRSLEELSFTYEKIEFIDVEKSISAQDTWRPAGSY